MAKNDTVLLDGIIEDRIRMSIPHQRKDEAFEFFVFEQLFKSYDLSKEEIELGWVDGRADGGIDGFYIFINGNYLTDHETFQWPRKNGELSVYIITCKHQDSYIQAPLDNLIASISELFDFTVMNEDLKGSYSDEILQQRNVFQIAYRSLSSALKKMTIHFVYASRGNTKEIGVEVLARSEQIKVKAKSLFSVCDVDFRFLGTTELIEINRSIKNFSLELPFIECISHGYNNIVIAELREYYKFVTDEAGDLKRYLFEANVRDFLGTNRVNEDIATTLTEDNDSDFWWLNNGVTILSTSSRVIGKRIHLEDVQIVNGLQTTHSIFNYFYNGGDDAKKRSVLIKIITLENVELRDKIIRATNNQSLVELSSLHATDAIQRDIEDILLRHGWFYERRKNYYQNIGKPSSRIIAPLYVAGGVVALFLKHPSRAAKLKSKFMRKEDSYSSVFNSVFPIAVWPKIVSVLKDIEIFIEKVRPTDETQTERFLSSWRNLVAFMVVSKKIGRFSFSPVDFAKNEFEIGSDDILEIWNMIDSERRISGNQRKYNDFNFIYKCCEKLAARYELTDIQVLGEKKVKSTKKKYKKVDVTDEFVEGVFVLLPVQPWKPGTHFEISRKLNCQPINVSSAISILVERGRCFRQKDGVVFDENDNIVAVDYERVTDLNQVKD